MRLEFKKLILLTLVVCGIIATIVVHGRWADSNISEPNVTDMATEVTEETEGTVSATTTPNEEVHETTDSFEETTVSETNNESDYQNGSHEQTGDVDSDEEINNSEGINLGSFTLTAYCSCVQCCGQYAINRPVDENGVEIVYGSTGTRLIAGVSIAVDPRVIPYGSKVVINGRTYIAHDTGGGINGNRIDVYFNNHQEALNFGVQYANVYLLAN